MEQTKKALNRAKKCFKLLEEREGSFYYEDEIISPGREIYEINLALNELKEHENNSNSNSSPHEEDN